MSGLEIIGVAFAAPPLIAGFCKLAKRMRRLAKDLEHAPIEVENIAHQTTIFGNNIDDFIAEVRESAAGWEKRRRRAAKLLIERSVVILDAFESALESVHMLNYRSDRSRMQTIVAALRWLSQKKGVLYLVANLSALRLSTSIFLSIEILRTIRLENSLSPKVRRILAVTETNIAKDERDLKDVTNQIRIMYEQNHNIMEGLDNRLDASLLMPDNIVKVVQDVTRLAHKEVRNFDRHGQYLGRPSKGSHPFNHSTSNASIPTDHTRSSTSSYEPPAVTRIPSKPSPPTSLSSTRSGPFWSVAPPTATSEVPKPPTIPAQVSRETLRSPNSIVSKGDSSVYASPPPHHAFELVHHKDGIIKLRRKSQKSPPERPGPDNQKSESSASRNHAEEGQTLRNHARDSMEPERLSEHEQEQQISNVSLQIVSAAESPTGVKPAVTCKCGLSNCDTAENGSILISSDEDASWGDPTMQKWRPIAGTTAKRPRKHRTRSED